MACGADGRNRQAVLDLLKGTRVREDNYQSGRLVVITPKWWHRDDFTFCLIPCTHKLSAREVFYLRNSERRDHIFIKYTSIQHDSRHSVSGLKEASGGLSSPLTRQVTGSSPAPAPPPHMASQGYTAPQRQTCPVAPLLSLGRDLVCGTQ